MATKFKSNGSFYVKFKDIDHKWKSKYIGRIKNWKNPKTGKMNRGGITISQAEDIRKKFDGQEFNRRHETAIFKIDLTPIEALNEFYENELIRGKRRIISNGTKISYEMIIRYLKKWFRKIEIRKLQSLNIEHIKNFVSDCNDISNSTLCHRQTVLLRFLQWCDNRGYWHKMRELNSIQRVQKVKPKLRYLSITELHRVFDAAPKFYSNAIKLQYYIGARVGEIGFLKWNNYNSERGTLTFEVQDGMKKKKETTVFLNSMAIKTIEDQRKKTGGDIYIFSNSRGGRLTSRNLSEVEKRIFDKLGIEGTSHILRHTFASQLASNGASLFQIKELLRHAYIEDTMIYAHLTESAQKEAVELLPV